MRFRSLFTVAFLFVASSVFAAPCDNPVNPMHAELCAERATYPTPMSKPQLGELLYHTVAKFPGWGLLKKPSGNNCPTPTGVAVSCDYLVSPEGQGYDVLVDEEGLATPVFNKGDVFSVQQLLVPGSGTPAMPTPTTSTPPPSTSPTPDTTAQNDFDTLVSMLKDHDAAVIGKLNDVLALDRENHDQAERIYTDLVNRLNALSARPTAAPVGSLPPVPSLPEIAQGGSTAGSIAVFVVKYVAPVIGGWIAARMTK